jgi:hypothetical protein
MQTDTRKRLKEVDDAFRLSLATHLNAKRLSVSMLRTDGLLSHVRAELRKWSGSVHSIANDAEMSTRFDSNGKICFGLFHQQLDVPLVFVESSLTNALAKRIEPLLRCDAEYHPTPSSLATHAIFYAIVNTRPNALAGLDLGRTLLHSVLSAMASDSSVPGLMTAPLDERTRAHVQSLQLRHLSVCATLSPMPGFRAWLRETRGHAVNANSSDLRALAREYLVTRARTRTGVVDGVAHFHLCNGARIECLNVGADQRQESERANVTFVAHARCRPYIRTILWCDLQLQIHTQRLDIKRLQL